ASAALDAGAEHVLDAGIERGLKARIIHSKADCSVRSCRACYAPCQMVETLKIGTPMRTRPHWMVMGVLLLALAARAPAAAQNYPSKQITIVVSLAAGSGMDTITRLYAEKLTEAFGKTVIVENKPGAATTLAAQQVAASPPDGHTLVVLTSIALSINPTLFKKL